MRACVCVRACVRVCARVFVCVCACVRACLLGDGGGGGGGDRGRESKRLKKYVNKSLVLEKITLQIVKMRFVEFHLLIFPLSITSVQALFERLFTKQWLYVKKYDYEVK